MSTLKDKMNQFLGRDADENIEKDNKNENNHSFDVEVDNLAVPEVHSKDYEKKIESSEAEQNRPKEKESIVFDSLAVPEIHIKKK